MDEGPLRRVWDLPVRIVHWLLVIGIAGSYATHKLGVAYFKYHLWFGYLVVVLAAFRILWGFVGTRHARFARFLRGPRATLAYLVGAAARRRARDAGSQSARRLDGDFPAAVRCWRRASPACSPMTRSSIPVRCTDTSATRLSLKLTSWHRRLFDWILIAVALHVLAVIAHRVFAGHDLIGPMFSGRKPAQLAGRARCHRLVAAVAGGRAAGGRRRHGDLAGVARAGAGGIRLRIARLQD